MRVGHWHSSIEAFFTFSSSSLGACARLQYSDVLIDLTARRYYDADCCCDDLTQSRYNTLANRKLIRPVWSEHNPEGQLLSSTFASTTSRINSSHQPSAMLSPCRDDAEHRASGGRSYMVMLPHRCIHVSGHIRQWCFWYVLVSTCRRNGRRLHCFRIDYCCRYFDGCCTNHLSLPTLHLLAQPEDWTWLE